MIGALVEKSAKCEAEGNKLKASEKRAGLSKSVWRCQPMRYPHLSHPAIVNFLDIECVEDELILVHMQQCKSSKEYEAEATAAHKKFKKLQRKFRALLADETTSNADLLFAFVMMEAAETRAEDESAGGRMDARL